MNMNKTAKKQKRRLTLLITSILLIVWLTVSVVFSYIALTNEKDSLITQEQQRFSRLRHRICKSSPARFRHTHRQYRDTP